MRSASRSRNSSAFNSEGDYAWAIQAADKAAALSAVGSDFHDGLGLIVDAPTTTAAGDRRGIFGNVGKRVGDASVLTLEDLDRGFRIEFLGDLILDCERSQSDADTSPHFVNPSDRSEDESQNDHCGDQVGLRLSFTADVRMHGELPRAREMMAMVPTFVTLSTRSYAITAPVAHAGFFAA